MLLSEQHLLLYWNLIDKQKKENIKNTNSKHRYSHRAKNNKVQLNILINMPDFF